MWDEPANRAALLAIVAGASAQPGAASALCEFVVSKIIGRLAAVVGHKRATLVATQVVGLIALRYMRAWSRWPAWTARRSSRS